MKKNIIKYSIYCTHFRTEMMSPSWRWKWHWSDKEESCYTRDTKESKKYECVCRCCHANDLPWYKCVIFLRNNYSSYIPAVANTLSERHEEIRQKKFICKPCHKQLKDGKYSNNFQNCVNSGLFGSNLNHQQDDQYKVHGSRNHNENNMTCAFPSNYTTQNTTLANYCLCTCCHKTDIPRSQCIIFKESKYNFGNTVVLKALSNRFSIPTSKEYICKKCDKYLLGGKMPMNSVASWTRLSYNEPQQKCIHCNSIPTDKFLTFDKTKYGENTFVTQMTENDEHNIICNKCHNTILRESLATSFTCGKTIKQMFTFTFDMNKYSSLWNKLLQMLTLKRTNCYVCKSCHLQLQTKFTCVCYNTDVHKHICKMYNKFCCITMFRTCIKFCK